jgi:hypothetical protein
MGGFHVYAPDNSDNQSRGPHRPQYPLDQQTVIDKVKRGDIKLPLEGEIQDKGKTDWLAKTLVLLQTGWFVIQCIARGVADLPLSELEVVTLAYTIMNVGIYIAWWDKPRNVDRPIRVFEPPYEVPKQGSSEPSKKDWKWFVQYLRDSLILRTDDVKLTTCSSVPTFYSGKPNKGRDFLPSVYVPSAVGVVFGAIHFIAWSYSFPSHTEQLLWRISSVAMVGVPVCVLVVSGLAPLGIWLDEREDESSIFGICLALVGLVVIFLFFVSMVLGPLVYAFARVTTFVLAFKTLSSLPAAAFQTIPWTKWIPHV